MSFFHSRNCSFTTTLEMFWCWTSIFLSILSSTSGLKFADQKYPCQPYEMNTTLLCDELFSLPRRNDGRPKFCNGSSASCNPYQTHTIKHNRGDAIWDRCYCDSLCKKLGDCCVDYDLWITPNKSSESLSSVGIECRLAPSSNTKDLYGFVMVASCPLTWREVETKRACMSTNYSADPASAVPAVDMTTNVTYANIHCAMCHGKSNNLHLWNIQIWMPRGNQATSLHAIRNPYTYWEVIPFANSLNRVEKRCVITPTAAITGHETKLKQLCRSYANGMYIKPLGTFKNPHCALLWNRTALDEKEYIVCDTITRVRPRLPSMLFVFGKTTKIQRAARGVIVLRVEYNCGVSEVYDPFQSRCIPAILESSPIDDKCTAKIRFLPSEFQILRNNSVLVFAHQMTYSNESFVLVNNTLILCSNFSKRRITSEDNGTQQHLVIYIITYVGFSLSITFLLFLLVTYFLFSELRTFPGKKVIHLSCALIAMQSVYLSSDPDVVSPAVCAVIGALLHYLILVVFLWMSVIAYNTQKTFASLNVNIQPVNDLLTQEQRRRTYIRNCVFCWGLPFVAVGICLTLQLTNTGNVCYGNDDGCQLNLPARTFAVAIPVSLMLLFNIGALIRTAVAIKTSGQITMASPTQRRLPLIVLKLTSVLGVTWILGFVLAFYQTPFLEYPYVIVNSCQGVLICLSFVFTKRVFMLYKQRFLSTTAPNLNGIEGQQ